MHRREGLPDRADQIETPRQPIIEGDRRAEHRNAGAAQPPFELADSRGPIGLWAAGGQGCRYEPGSDPQRKRKHRGEHMNLL